MKNLIKILSIFIFISTLLFSAKVKEEKKIDKETGLIIAKGMDIVKANCTACHSAKFIIHQRGDRKTWKDMIVWMQETQGLWQFDAKTEKTILDYLATNYAADNSYSRRANLKDSELPKNPYKTK